MSYITCDFLILAKSDEEVKKDMDRWLDDCIESKEFFDYAEIKEVVQLTAVRQKLIKYKEEVFDDRLPEIKKDIEKYEREGSKSMEGYLHIKYGDILCENLCTEMPFYNADYWDWTIPENDIEDGKTWYAVTVSLHY